MTTPPLHTMTESQITNELVSINRRLLDRMSLPHYQVQALAARRRELLSMRQGSDYSDWPLT